MQSNIISIHGKRKLSIVSEGIYGAKILWIFFHNPVPIDGNRTGARHLGVIKYLLE